MRLNRLHRDSKVCVLGPPTEGRQQHTTVTAAALGGGRQRQLGRKVAAQRLWRAANQQPPLGARRWLWEQQPRRLCKAVCVGGGRPGSGASQRRQCQQPRRVLQYTGGCAFLLLGQQSCCCGVAPADKRSDA